MNSFRRPSGIVSLGIVGFGAFGRLMADRLRPHAAIFATDGRAVEGGGVEGVTMTDLTTVCACDIVILAVPVGDMLAACRSMAPLLRPGALVMDIGSVKVEPAAILLSELPDHVEIAATHPLFGPQSIAGGTAGLKMVICPLRGRMIWRGAAFLRKAFGLSILFTTPEEHDREAALTQGLTHLLARIMLRMGPLPERVTTRSFDLVRQAVDMVRHDAAGVGRAIEHRNPFAADARHAFFREADAVRQELAEVEGYRSARPPETGTGRAVRSGICFD
ncbi:MAG: prephenate dehydrogenase/arogenate dehydrogenase family protein [Sphingobium sp.]